MQQKINSIETEVKTVWKEHAMKIINYEEKEMIPVTNEETSIMKCKKFAIHAKNKKI